MTNLRSLERDNFDLDAYTFYLIMAIFESDFAERQIHFLESSFNQQDLHKISKRKERILRIQAENHNSLQEKDMELKPNPICKTGERNIYCPFYSDCLDHAVNHFWRHWSCSQCPYRNIKAINEFECGADGEDRSYEFSPDIIRKIGGK